MIDDDNGVTTEHLINDTQFIPALVVSNAMLMLRSVANGTKTEPSKPRMIQTRLALAPDL